MPTLSDANTPERPGQTMNHHDTPQTDDHAMDVGAQLGGLTTAPRSEAPRFDHQPTTEDLQ